MKKWVIRATMTIIVLISMTGFSYGDSSVNTQTTVNIPSTIGITASNDLNFNVLTTDGQWYSANEGGVTITSTGNVQENIMVRDNNYNYNPGISYQIYSPYYGSWYPLYNWDNTIYYNLQPNQQANFQAEASASGTYPGTYYDSWTWSAMQS